jgi:uncharacterized Fe-S radical SAM superfamily protein PflX
MKVVIQEEADRNLRDAERMLRTAVSEQAREMQIEATAAAYREALEQYRIATQVSEDISKALRRTLEMCATCERRCPGLPACELGR